MKGLNGVELTGPGVTVGVLVWLVMMGMVGAQHDPGLSMGVSLDAIVLGIVAIGVLAPAWVAASLVSMFFEKK
jgi:hypothetical protein